jgi:hypothetical protein
MLRGQRRGHRRAEPLTQNACSHRRMAMSAYPPGCRASGSRTAGRSSGTQWRTGWSGPVRASGRWLAGRCASGEARVAPLLSIVRLPPWWCILPGLAQHPCSPPYALHCGGVSSGPVGSRCSTRVSSRTASSRKPPGHETILWNDFMERNTILFQPQAPHDTCSIENATCGRGKMGHRSSAEHNSTER